MLEAIVLILVIYTKIEYLIQIIEFFQNLVVLYVCRNFLKIYFNFIRQTANNNERIQLKKLNM